MHYEQRALYWGVGINIFSAILGIAFFIYTKSQTLFLDGFISLILCLSTFISLIVTKIVNKKDSEKYPLGRYAIENLFLIFRAILMMGIILYTLIEGGYTIYQFYNGTLTSDLNIDYVTMLIYCALMVGSCLMITFTYSYYNHKLEVPSEIIKLEITSSIYDGLVTLFATASLLIFTYVPFLEPIQPIGDSIVVIILSIIYLIIPIKEVVKQIRILTDKRENQDIEKEIKVLMNTEYAQYKIYDIYCSYSGDVCSIYICLFPKEDIKSSQINEEFDEMRETLAESYSNSKIILLLSQSKLHKM